MLYIPDLSSTPFVLYWQQPQTLINDSTCIDVFVPDTEIIICILLVYFFYTVCILYEYTRCEPEHNEKYTRCVPEQVNRSDSYFLIKIKIFFYKLIEFRTWNFLKMESHLKLLYGRFFFSHPTAWNRYTKKETEKLLNNFMVQLRTYVDNKTYFRIKHQKFCLRSRRDTDQPGSQVCDRRASFIIGIYFTV